MPAIPKATARRRRARSSAPTPRSPACCPRRCPRIRPLKQVVSHTYETGLRGNFTLPDTLPGKFRWNVGLFRTDLNNDIYGVATSISTGLLRECRLDAATRDRDRPHLQGREMVGLRHL